MSIQAKTSLIVGITFLLLTITNAVLETNVTPSLQRAELLSAIASVCLILVAFLWSGDNPKKKNPIFIDKKQGIYIDEKVTEFLRNELAWGSQMLLTATPAATLLIYWDNKTLIKRGIISASEFKPGDTCYAAQKKVKLLSLANTKFFPGRYEFDSILEDIPSLIIYPLVDRGWLIIGGSSERCFSISDEKWIKGWSDRLIPLLINQI